MFNARTSGVGTIKVEAVGTRKLFKKLDALPHKIREKIIRKAMSKATTYMKREIVKRAPVGTGAPKGVQGKDERPRKRLKKSFVKSMRNASGNDGVHGVVGVPSYYPRFVYMLHYGIKPHTISGKNGNPLSFAGGLYYSVRHPGVEEMGFMYDALVASIPKARSVMRSEIRSRLASVAK